MSRIGNKPVPIPSGVNVELNGQEVTAKGPKGEMSFVVNDEVLVSLEENELKVSPRSKAKRARSMWGMSRTRLANLVQGVHEGFSVKLEINGVGYRAAVKGKTLNLQLGFSHDIDYPIPEGLDVKCPSQVEIEVSGSDKQQVGQFAAEVRAFRPPEPYKGKGVKYAGEYIFRKEGKKK